MNQIKVKDDATSKPPRRPGRVSKADLKKHVGLIHSSSELGLVERKLFNWLLLSSFERLQFDVTHELPLTILKAMMGWERSNNNDGIDAALKRLMSTIVHFSVLRPKRAKSSANEDTEDAWEAAALLSYAAVVGGRVAWRFDPAMAEKLRDPAVFHMLNVAAAQGLQSSFAYALYENTARFYKTQSTGEIPIPVLRALLNASAPIYDDFRYLKQRVITPSIKEINDITDIEVEPHYAREGRSVVSVRFTVKVKPQSSLLAQQQRGVDDLTVDERSLHERMVRLGLPSRAAINMIEARGIETARQCVELTESKLQSGAILHSASAYLQRVLESPPKAVLVTSATEFSRTAQANVDETRRVLEKYAPISSEAAESRSRLTTAIDLMTLDQRRRAAKDFASQHAEAGPTWDDGRAKFAPKWERLFGLYLRSWMSKEP